MRISVALITAALLTWATCSTQAQWDAFNNDSPRWKMEASILALDRSGDDNGIPLVSDTLTLETLLDSDRATDLNTAAGMDILLQFQNRFGVEMDIKGSYARWDRDANIIGPGIETPFLPIGFEPFDVNYLYESDLFSLELNCRREITPCFTFLYGPRFVYLDEHVQFDTATEIVPPVPLPIFDIETTDTVDTKNPLLGFQIGADLDFQLVGNFYMKGFIKAGAYANWSTAFLQHQETGFDDIESERHKSGGSFVGETGGRIYYWIIPSACSFYAGYQAQWIDNLALAPVQLYTFDNIDEDVILGSTAFIQGAVFGFEFQR